MIVGESRGNGGAAGALGSLSLRGAPQPPDTRWPLVGFEFYDGPVAVRGVAFRRFLPTRRRAAEALGYLRYTPWFTDPRNTAAGLSFDAGSRRVGFDPVALKPARSQPLIGDGYKSAAFVDADGSVTGQPGATVEIASAPADYSNSKTRPEWNARVVPQPLAHLFIDVRAERPTPVAPLMVSSGARALYGTPTASPRTSFQLNVAAGGAYGVRLAAASALPPLRLAVRFPRPGDWLTVIVTLPKCAWSAAAAAGGLRVCGDNHFGTPLAAAADAGALRAGAATGYRLLPGGRAVATIEAAAGQA